MTTTRKLLTVKQYARRVGMRPSSIYRKLHRGSVPDALRIGTAWRIYEPVDPAADDDRKAANDR